MSVSVPLPVKGLSKTGGRNKFRFENTSDRLKALETDVAKNIRAQHEQYAAPDEGDDSSFFRQEFERWRDADISKQFKEFAWKINPLCRTMKLLVHHSDAIITEILETLKVHNSVSWKALLSLLAVLARDLKSEVYRRWSDIVAVLKSMIQPIAAPEVTAETFRTISFLFKYLAADILNDPDYAARFNDWIGYLSHKRTFVRESMAAALALLLRRSTSQAQRMQLYNILRGATVVPEPSKRASKDLDSFLRNAADCAVQGARNKSSEYKDGIALLIFESISGPNHGFHSRTQKILPFLLASASPKKSKFSDLLDKANNLSMVCPDTSASSKDAGKKRSREKTGSVTLSKEASDRYLPLVSLYQLSLSLRHEILAQAVRYACAHTTGSHSDCRDLWSLLVASFRNALKQFVEAEAALGKDVAVTGQSAPTNNSKSLVQQAAASQLASIRAKRAAKASGGSSKQDIEVNHSGSNNLADKHYAVTSGMYVGMMAGLLNTWVTYRKGSRIPMWAPDLADVLLEAFSSSVWKSENLPGLTRVVLLRLLVASWSHICAPKTKETLPKTRTVRIKFTNSGKKSLEPPKRVKRQRRLSFDSDDDYLDMEMPPEEPSDLESVDSDSEESIHEADLDAWNAGAQRLGKRLLQSVFDVPKNLPIVRLETLSEIVMSSSSGIILAQSTEEGLQYPDLQRAGKSGDYRPVHVGTLDTTSSILSFARQMIVLTGHIEDAERQLVLANNGNEDVVPKAGVATLQLLLPALSSYITYLMQSTPGAQISLSNEDEEVVWSLLLSARDAIIPRGSRKGLLGLQQDIPGIITRYGRLILSQDEDRDSTSVANILLRRLTVVQEQIGSHVDSFIPSLVDAYNAGDIEQGEADLKFQEFMRPIFGAVSATSTIVLPFVDTVLLLKDIFLSSVSSVHKIVSSFHAAGLVTSPWKLPKSVGILQHVAASALLSISRFLKEADGSMLAEMLSQEDIAPIFSLSFVNTALQWLFETTRAVPVASQPHAVEAFGSPEGQRATASALAALNASAEFFLVIKESSPVEVYNTLMTVPLGQSITYHLRELLGHRDHAIRLSALRVMCAFPAEDYLGAGVLSPALLDIAVPKGSETEKEVRRVLLDERVLSSADSTLSGPCPILMLMLQLELLPNTIATERLRLTIITRICVYIASKKVPPVTIVALMHFSLGLFFTRFAPVSKASQKMVLACADIYPRTLWSIFCRHLYAACIDRQPPLDTSTGPSTAALAKTRSQGRMERINAPTVPLRVSTLAINAATGHSTDAMSMAGTIIAEAAAADAMIQEETSDPSAALPPGREELMHRIESLLEGGLYGADAGIVDEEVKKAQEFDGSMFSTTDGELARHKRDMMGTALSHALVHVNDSVPLILGEAGWFDSETIHKSMLEVLVQAPSWAESRARTLIPLFVAFVAYDYFGRTFVGDPDGYELRLDLQLQELLRKHKQFKEHRVARRSSEQDDVSTATDVIADTDVLLERLVIGDDLKNAPNSLSRSTASARLISYLRVLAGFSGWKNMVGRDVVENMVMRLAGRPDDGIGSAAFQVLISMKHPELMPYKDTISRFLGDSSYREEIASFSLAHDSGNIVSEHRASLIPLIVRILQGRLLARKSGGQRETPAARRNTILSYFATLKSDEMASLLYITMRPFLLASSGNNESSIAMPGSTLEDMQNTLASFRMPESAQDAVEVVKKIRESFVAQGDICEGSRLVNAARAVGFLNLLQTLIRRVGTSISPYMHVIVGIVIACLHETRVALHESDSQDVDDVDLDDIADFDDFNKSLENSNRQVEADVELNAVPVVEADVPVAASALIPDTGFTALQHKAKAIRTLALDRLSDIIENWTMLTGQSYSDAVPSLAPWIPLLRESLDVAIDMLPGAMMYSTKPSAVLNFLSTMSKDPSLLQILYQFPAALPAIFACTTTGIDGSSEVYSEHKKFIATGGATLSMDKFLQNSIQESKSQGPHLNVLNVALHFMDNFVEFGTIRAFDDKANPIVSIDTDEQSTSALVLKHIPYLLKHLILRLGASTRSPQTLNMLLEAVENGTPLATLPSLKGGVRAFAKRQLSILAKISDLIVAKDTDKFLNIEQSAIIQRLVVLLLPFTKMRSPRAANSNKRAKFEALDGEDPAIIVLQILCKFAPYLPENAAVVFLPMFTQMLAPGPRALDGKHRVMVARLLTSLTQQPSLRHLDNGMSILQKLCATASTLIGEIDFDSVFNGLEAFILPQNLNSFITPGKSARVLPALMYQIVYLMMDVDTSIRTAALNAASAVVRAAAQNAIANWRNEVEKYRGMPAPEEPTQISIPSILASDDLPAHEISLFVVGNIIVPSIRSAMNTASPTLRRGLLALLAEVVREFQEYGAIRTEVHTSSKEKPRTEGSHGEGKTTLGAPNDDTELLEKLEQKQQQQQQEEHVDYKYDYYLTHPNLYLDLGSLINRVNPEADVFLNLSHLQIHRRAQALNRLAAFVKDSKFTVHTVRTILLPLTLHSLYDEAGAAGGIDVVVESKGKTASLVNKGSAVNAGYTSGLHAEAVKLIGEVAKIIPFPLYISTLRSLIRQVENCDKGPLEKVLVRAISVMADGFRFDIEPVLPSDETSYLRCDERAFCRLLASTMDSWGVTGRSARAEALAMASAADEDAEDSDPQEMDVDEPEEPAVLQSSDPGGSASSDAAEEATAEDDEAGKDHEDTDMDDDEEGEEEGDGVLGDISLDAKCPEFVQREITRRSILLTLAADILPPLRRILHRPEEVKASDNDMMPRKAHMSRPKTPTGEVRPPVAQALVTFYRILPKPVFFAQMPNVLMDLAGALKSRRQTNRDTARATLARTALVLGPRWLGSIIECLRSTLYADGYQLHVLGHAVFSVIEVLAPHMVPVAPAAPVMKAGKGLPRKERAKTRLNAEKRASQDDAEQSEQDDEAVVDEVVELVPQEEPMSALEEGDGNIVPAAASDDEDDQPGAGSLHLAKCVSALMEIIMEEVNGAAAQAKAAGSGYKPKESLGLKEAKSSRAGDTLEIIAKCIPFLPHPSLHYITAPIIAAFEDDAMKGFGKYTAALNELFRRVSVGLAHNPSVTGPYLLLYAHGICTEFLRISTLTATHQLLREQELTQEDTKLTQKALEALPAEHSAYQEAYAKFARFLRPKGVGKMKTINPWMTRDINSIMASKQGHLNADGTIKHIAPDNSESAVPLTGAMRLKGTNVSSFNPDLYRVLPEPRMTGVGRYVYTDKGGRNSGAASAADVPMGGFALSLILAGMVKHRISLHDPLHRQMLDPYIVLLLRLLEEQKDTKVTTLVMRLFTNLLNTGLPMIRKLGSRICRAILTVVERTSGGSTTRDDMNPRTELAQASLRAATVLVRACEHTKISDEQLRALLAIIRQDIHIPVRQNATFSLLRAILGRKLVCVEIYDVMDTCAKLLVTALSPSARSQASGAFLLFLLHYPMVDKVLTRHLDFFIRNLGYELEPGRLSVIDILGAIINKFPQPVLDSHAPALLLPFALRLASDPSVACRAGVSALIVKLMKSVSQPTAVEMVGLIIQWFNPSGKPGIRKIAAQVLGLMVDSRPSLFQEGPLLENGTLRAIVSALTSELLSASMEVVLIEYNAEKQYLIKQEKMRLKRERSLARKAGLSGPNEVAASAHGDAMDEDIGEPVTASTPVVSDDEDVNNDGVELSHPTLEDMPAPDFEASTRAEQRAMARMSAISSGRAAVGNVPDDKDPDVDAFELTKFDAEVVTSSMKEWDLDEEYVEEAEYSRFKGTTGGVIDKEGEDDVMGAGFVDPFASSHRKKNTLNVSLQWEPVYHALIAAEKLWTHCHEAVESMITEGNITFADGKDCDAALIDKDNSSDDTKYSSVQKLEMITKQYIASLVKQVPEDWKPTAGTFATHDVSTTSLDLLTYPHAWVRLAASRLLGLILSRRDVDILAGVGQSAAEKTGLDVEASVSTQDSDPRDVDTDSSGEEESEEAALDIDQDDADDSLLAQFEELCIDTYSEHDPALPWVASRTILRRVARSSTTQLTSNHLTPVLAEQVCKNLIFVTLALHATTPVARRNPIHPLVLEGQKRDLEAAQAVDQEEDEEELGKEVLHDDSSTTHLLNPIESSIRDPVYSIISRISHIARTRGDLAKSTALKFIAAITMKLPPHELCRYLYPIVRLLFRLTSVDLRADEITPETRFLASEAMEFVQSTVGMHAFLRLFNAERARFNSARIARKRDKAIMRIVNPEEAERLRRKKLEVTARQRKAKIAKFKAARGVSAPLSTTKGGKKSKRGAKRQPKPDGNVRHQLGGTTVQRPPIVQ